MTKFASPCSMCSGQKSGVRKLLNLCIFLIMLLMLFPLNPNLCFFLREILTLRTCILRSVILCDRYESSLYALSKQWENIITGKGCFCSRRQRNSTTVSDSAASTKRFCVLQKNIILVMVVVYHPYRIRTGFYDADDLTSNVY